MKPPAFAYHDPQTVEEAVEIKTEHGSDALVLAGGLSILPVVYARLRRPKVMLDINRVREMQRIGRTDTHLEIGAGARQSDAEHSDDVARAVPLLPEAITYIGHPEIRNRGTVGGSISFADPATELPCVAVTLDAEILAVGPAGERTIPAAEFFVGHLENALADDEIVVTVRWPVSEGFHGYHEVSRRVGDRPLVAAAAQLGLAEDGTVTSAAIGVGNIADRPVRAGAAEQVLVGRVPTGARITEAARSVVEQVTNGEDVHATLDYRRSAAATVVERAVQAAVRRGAKGAAA